MPRKGLQKNEYSVAAVSKSRKADGRLPSNFRRMSWRDDSSQDANLRYPFLMSKCGSSALIKERQITLHVRFKGGATQRLTLPRPLSAWELRMTSAATIAEIDRLLDDLTEGQIAVMLNQRGLRSGEGKPTGTILRRYLRALSDAARVRRRTRDRDHTSVLDDSSISVDCVSQEFAKRFRRAPDDIDALADEQRFCFEIGKVNHSVNF
jgi:hypothetical protein